MDTALMPAADALLARTATVDRDVCRCLVVDDHPAVRVGLEQLLAAEPDLEVVAACSTAEEGLSHALRDVVDVAVVDHDLGGRSGLWLTRRLRPRLRRPRVIVYSAHGNHLLAAACIVAGASALVSKAAVGDDLIATVRDVARGDTRLPRIPPALADSIQRRFDRHEQPIFGLMAAGSTPAEVAATLRMSEREVDERLGRMLGALQSSEGRRAA